MNGAIGNINTIFWHPGEGDILGKILVLVTTEKVVNKIEVQNFPKYVPLPGVQKNVLILPIAPLPG